MISSMTVSHASIPLVLLDEFVPSAITAHGKWLPVVELLEIRNHFKQCC